MELDRGGDAGDRAFGEGPPQAPQGVVAVNAPHDQLADQGVVEGGDLVARVHVAVDSHAGPARWQPAGDLAGGRAEVVAGILGVDAAFDRMADEAHVLLAHREGFAAGDAQLLSDQVDAGHHLGDRVFHLDAGVHLHEVEAAAAVHQELHRAGALVADAAGRRYGRLAHAPPQLWIEPRAWGFLQEFLVAPLNGAVALAQVHHIAVAIGQHLHFHMAGPVDEFLHVEAGVAEGRLRFALGRLEEVLELIRTGHQPHATAATASCGLDHHRVAHLVGKNRRLLGAFEEAFAARNRGHPHGLHGGLGGGFIAHGPDRFGRGSHEGDAVVAADLGEAVVLGQEAVAGMDGVGTAGGGRRENVRDVEVAAAAGGFAHAHRLVGELHMQGVAIHRAVHGHGGNAQLPAGAQDPEGDLATVGDQQLADGHPQRAGRGRTDGPGRCGLYQRSQAPFGGQATPAMGIVTPDPARPEPPTRMWWNW